MSRLEILSEILKFSSETERVSKGPSRIVFSTESDSRSVLLHRSEFTTHSDSLLKI